MSLETKKWYRDYLKTTDWKKVKDKVYKKHKICQICGKKFGLDGHHAFGYERLGQKSEWKDVRLLCRACHKRCHWIFWIFKIPLTPFWLSLRYYQVKIFYKLWELIKSYVP